MTVNILDSENVQIWSRSSISETALSSEQVKNKFHVHLRFLGCSLVQMIQGLLSFDPE